MRIDSLHSRTSARLVVIAVDATVRTAASALSNPHIGLLVVCDENRKATGVVSKSDLIRHLASAGVAEAPIGTLMSRSIISCRPEPPEHTSAWHSIEAAWGPRYPRRSGDTLRARRT